MGFASSVLAHDEYILHSAKFHWLYTLTASGLLLTLFWVFGLGIAIFAIMMIRKWTTELVVTNRRIIFKRGWIARRTEELALNRIEEIRLLQSVPGRLLQYGRVSIGGIGVSTITTPTIAHPLDLRKAIYEAQAVLASST